MPIELLYKLHKSICIDLTKIYQIVVLENPHHNILWLLKNKRIFARKTVVLSQISPCVKPLNNVKYQTSGEKCRKMDKSGE